MQEIRNSFQTTLSVKDCEATFRQSVKNSFSGGRKLIASLGSMRGNISGGIEFFSPPRGQFDESGRSPNWQGGALVPGHSKAWGATKMAVHIYVVDDGETREVQLVGPYRMGDKGSTERLVKSIRSGF